MNFEKYKYVVVEGPIGVGKTTLARKIAEGFGAQTLL
jgi:deoxyadenosine/deoxycytidine kinase